MGSKTALLFIILVMLPSTMLGARFIFPVEGTPAIIEVPTPEYPTIQAAINAANPGDIIQVASGTYYEHVVMTKSLTLVGENRNTTIIDGSGTGLVIRSNASDVEIRGFTVQNGGYFANGSILLGSCVRNTIRDCIVGNSGFGIELHESNDSAIVGNIILNNAWAGIRVVDSSNNEIRKNVIVNNSLGVWITSDLSLLNTLCYNSFIDNKVQAADFATTTRWDNGAGKGNYWSDYTGVDDGSGNRTADDGVGDTLLPHSGLDYYPLMEPWRLIGDVNKDGIVDKSDVILILINAGRVPPKPRKCDINKDSSVNVLDLIICLLHFEEDC